MPEKCSVEFCCVLLRERVKGKVIFREGTKRRADVPRQVNRTLLNVYWVGPWLNLTLHSFKQPLTEENYVCGNVGLTVIGKSLLRDA